MGTTIRRQPITASIPASPDYKFLNITNFGGIQKSSNPFVTSSNTASDCLNVYIDEDNALSTRPRLQPKYDLPKLAGLSKYELLAVYSLSNGYLLHVLVDGNGEMYKFEESPVGLSVPEKITGEIPDSVCVLFEQNNRIYVLTGNGYKNIINNKLTDVEGYIPTTTIGKWEPKVSKNEDGVQYVEYLTAGKTYESINILNNKYKETYFWDGTWDLADVMNAGDSIENNYVKHEQHKITAKTDWLQNDTVILQYIRAASENSENYNYYLAFNSQYDYENDHNLLILTTDKNNALLENSIIPIPMSVYDYTPVTAIASADGKTIVVAKRTNDEYIDNKIHVFTRNSVGETVFTESTYDEEPGVFGGTKGYFTSLDMDDSGKYITYIGNLNLVRINTESQTSTVLKTYDATSHLPVLYWLQRQTPNNIVVFMKGANSSIKSKWIMIDTDGVETELPTVWDTQLGESLSAIGSVAFSSNSLVAYVLISPTERTESNIHKIIHIKNLKDAQMNYEILDTLKPGNRALTELVMDDSGDYAYIADYLNKTGFVYLLTTGKKLSHVYYDSLTMNRPYAKDGVVFGTKITIGLNYSGLHEDYLALESSEPLITITRMDAENDYIDIFNKAKLVQRFDNNTWFASGNSTFHTLYNDPTYIPLSSYNDLGEDYEPITGLSIVNDNILAAYKRNKIYIITPTTVGNELTYSYTETKNVIGNDVIGSPILTILTEMPTLVSYDGIYALNQLENVQSSDRITTLISENINPLWLKESKSDIDGCLTMNRLYWTYYILPHEKTGAEKKDYTKIYLLDNRSQQWYYWELPILVASAFVKDNKTHFADSWGKVFTLETTDTIHEYNPDVTEYYDMVNKTKIIIPWYWHSQILSLNTINYAKRLIDTTFILTDTDTQDEYGLDYSFKAWRKSVSETNAQTINSNIHYVQSTTKRTMIPRFNFIQIRLSNTEEDLDNNKLRLVGLGLKYVLLEGLY